MDPWEEGTTGAGRGFVSWGLPGPDPAALKGATGRIGKIPTYVKRSRALKSARSFSPKFRAGRRRVSPTPSPTSTNPANVCLTRPGAPAPPLEPFLGVRISEHPKSRTCIEKPDLYAQSDTLNARVATSKSFTGMIWVVLVEYNNTLGALSPTPSTQPSALHVDPCN